MPTIFELEESLQKLTIRYPNTHTYDSAAAFLSVHLQLIDLLETSNPEEAIKHCIQAEHCQSILGTFSTGSGEGLASMLALYDIMARRAELEEQLSNKATCQSEELLHLQAAIEIWRQIKADPNLGELLPQKDLLPLVARLKSLATQPME